MHDPVAGIEAIQMPRSMGLAHLKFPHKRIMCLDSLILMFQGSTEICRAVMHHPELWTSV
jgi:hypothetical protein